MPGPRQHVIPSFHLSQFANADGQVWIYDALGASPRADLPDRISAENHFYSAERPDGTYDNALDQFITDVEGKAVPVYRDMLAGRMPTGNAKRDFALYLAVMMFRTRVARRSVGDVIGKHFQAMNYATASSPKAFEASLRRFEEHDGGEPLDEETVEMIRDRMLNPGKYTMKINKELTFAPFAATPKLAIIFEKMAWSTLELQEGFFITSDNPVMRETDPKTHHPFYGDGGLTNPSTIISFPLNPQKSVFLSWRDKMPEHVTAKLSAAPGFHDALAATSEQFLYSHVRDDSLAALAVKHKDSKPGYRVDGFGPPAYADVQVMRRKPK
jgi:hypothetical protein